MKFDAKFEQMSSNKKLDEIYSKFDCFLMKRIYGNASHFSSAPEFNLVILEWLMKMKLFKDGTFVDTKHTHISSEKRLQLEVFDVNWQLISFDRGTWRFRFECNR